MQHLLGALSVRRRLPSRGARGRSACDYIRGWLHYTMQAYGRLACLAPDWFGPDAAHARAHVNAVDASGVA